MVDPITGAVVGGAANAVGKTVIEKIVRGEDDHEEWLQQVVKTATESEAARRYCFENARQPQRTELERLMERLGMDANKLEVIGERQGYADEEVNAVQRLAEVCNNYATAVKANNLDEEEELSEELPPLVNEIFSFAE